MTRLVVMGVAGSGKSTLGAALAERLGCPLVEADDLHLPEARRKMRQGIALDDADREPWLDRIAEGLRRSGDTAVATCSALKRAYRDRLRQAVPGLRFIYLEIAEADAARRVRARRGHDFPASLVRSQFEALEPPIGEPAVHAIPALWPPPQQIDEALRTLPASAPAPRS